MPFWCTLFYFRKGDYLTMNQGHSKSIVRNIDPVGRITIPREILHHFNLWKTDLIISVDNDKIVLEKYVSRYQCFFCEDTEQLLNYKDYRICKNCLQSLLCLYRENFELKKN